MKKLIITTILLLALCSTAHADYEFNPNDVAGEVVTMATKNIVLTTLPGSYNDYFLIDKDTKVIYHNKSKKIALGSIVKYSTYLNDNGFMSADKVHVYAFDQKLLN